MPYRIKITIDETKVAGPLEDFPVVITEENMPDSLWGNVQSDGSDIWCSLPDGTKLKREVVNINTITQKMELWVKMPNLLNTNPSATTDNVFYLNYGDSELSESNDEDTWDSNYKIVQHMTFDANETGDPALDSTNQDNGGTIVGGMLYPFSLVATFDVFTNLSIVGHDGMTYGNGFYYLVGQNNKIWKLSRTGNTLSIVTSNLDFIGDLNTDTGGAANGISGPAYYNGYMYIGVYGAVDGEQRVAILDADTLEYVDNVDLTGDSDLANIDSIAVDGTNVYMVRFGAGAGFADTIYVYNFDANPLLWTSGVDINVSSGTISSAQGIMRLGDFLYVACNAGKLRKYKLDGTYLGDYITSNKSFGTQWGHLQGGGYDDVREEFVFFLTNSTLNEHALFVKDEGVLDGKVGDAKSFTGNVDYINIDNASIFSGNEYTMEGWFYAYDTALVDGVRHFLWETSDSNWPISAEMGDSDVASNLKMYARKTGGDITLDTNWVPTAETWYHLVVVCSYPGGVPTLNAYVNNVLTTNSPASNGVGTLNTHTGFHIGSFRDGDDRFWEGMLDEVRLSEGVRTIDYITTCYNNQNSPATFYSAIPANDRPTVTFNGGFNTFNGGFS